MSRLTFSIIAAGTIALAAGHVSAQTVSNDALAREQQQINTTRRATFDEAASDTARYRGVMPSSDAIDAEMSRIQRSRDRQVAQAAAKAAHDGNAFPNLPTPAPAAGADPFAVAKRYESRTQRRVSDSFVAFASFSMPAASLVRLVKTMNQAGGTVVFRGFKNDSLKATAAEMQRLGIASGGIVVNPKAFTQYRIARVPAYVVTRGGDANSQVDSSGCALPASYVSLSGDVTPAYALRQIVDHSPTYGGIAERYLRALGDVE